MFLKKKSFTLVHKLKKPSHLLRLYVTKRIRSFLETLSVGFLIQKIKYLLYVEPYKDCSEKKLTNVFLYLISGPKL